MLVAAVGLVGCGSPYRPAVATDQEIEVLASDAHVVVGEVPLVLPLIALPDYASAPAFSRDRDRVRALRASEAFRLRARDPSTAPQIDALQVALSAFGWRDGDPAFHRICPRLTRVWSRSICDDPFSPLVQAAPENRFYLADLTKPEAFDGHLTVGRERVGDQLRAMRLRADEVSTVCDSKPTTDTRFCTAAVRINGRLGAVWAVWDSPRAGEDHRRQSEREGRAIIAFATYALRSSERFETLLPAACAARRPGSPANPDHRDACQGI